MSNKQNDRYEVKMSVSVLMFVAFILAGVFTPPIHAAEILPKTFEFGPGTPNDHSNFRTLTVPARTTVSVLVQFSAGRCDSPVVVELRQASADSIGTTGPDGPLIASSGSICPTANFSFQNRSFISQFGCPSTWRVRVRTASNLRPAVRTAGTINLAFSVPDSEKLVMEGGKLNLDAHTISTDRTLAGFISSSISSRALIAGTGTFRIRAKWHTDPGAAFPGTFDRLKVSLLRPDGTTASSQTGYSQHTPADKIATGFARVSFNYTVSAQEAVMPGTWRLRIRNNSDHRIVDFNIKNSFDSLLDTGMRSFNSTFLAQCNGF